ncbi:MAG: hypothetical protein KDD64_00840 [Bdellovibrionales bacterium]|nr:hypothetical protein [Bdellovibrionales bacterium]
MFERLKSLGRSPRQEPAGPTLETFHSLLAEVASLGLIDADSIGSAERVFGDKIERLVRDPDFRRVFSQTEKDVASYSTKLPLAQHVRGKAELDARLAEQAVGYLRDKARQRAIELVGCVLAFPSEDFTEASLPARAAGV